jgi:hypothetical protein
VAPVLLTVAGKAEWFCLIAFMTALLGLCKDIKTGPVKPILCTSANPAASQTKDGSNNNIVGLLA